MDLLHELQGRINNNITCIIDVVKEGKSVGDPDVRDDQLSGMKTAMLECILLQKKLSNFQQAVEHVQSKANSTKTQFEDMEIKLQEQFDKLNKGIEDNLTSNDSYKALMNEMDSRFTESETAESSEENVEDGEPSLLMTKEITIPLDPITKKRLVDPVVNKICKHIYERESIMQHIANRRKHARCPVGGCGSNAFLHPDILEDDIHLKGLIARSKRGDEF